LRKNRATFQKVKIRDIAKINPDSVGRDYQPEKIEYVDISNVGSGNITETQEMDIQNAPSRAKRLVKSGDTILSTVRPNKRSFFYFKSPKNNTVVSTGFAVLRALGDNNPKYLYYSVTDQAFTDYLTNNAKGAAYPAVDANIIYDGEVFVPKKKEDQVRIASVLSTYDDLIENNEKRIKVLEEMAQRLYTEWFVKFKYPGHKKAKMVESGTEYGMIPEGWNIRKLGDVVSFLEGPGLRNWQYRDSGIPFLNIRTIVDGDIDIDECNYLDIEEVGRKYSHFLLKENDIVISSSGTLGRLATIRKKHLPLCLNTSVIRFREIKDGLPFWFVRQYLLSPLFQSKIRSLASGSAQLNYGSSHLSTISIVMPKTSILDEYNHRVNHVEEGINNIRGHVAVLCKIRDLLVPQLVTGKRELKY